jgi:hypothetical protein
MRSGCPCTYPGPSPSWRVVDNMGDQALARQVRDRLIGGDSDGFAAAVLPAVGTVARSVLLTPGCCDRETAKLLPTISTAATMIRGFVCFSCEHPLYFA